MRYMEAESLWSCAGWHVATHIQLKLEYIQNHALHSLLKYILLLQDLHVHLKLKYPQNLDCLGMECEFLLHLWSLVLLDLDVHWRQR